MKIEVKLFATFRENRFSRKIVDVKSGVTVGEIVTDLSIPHEEIGVTMIHGRHCTMETPLKENDSLGIFPMIGGG